MQLKGEYKVENTSQSLFYWKLLCNKYEPRAVQEDIIITILILLETPLQLLEAIGIKLYQKYHNPYFTGNSFAICVTF